MNMFTLYFLSKPSAEKVKEVTDFSKECLVKLEMARTNGDYHEVGYCATKATPKQLPS